MEGGSCPGGWALADGARPGRLPAPASWGFPRGPCFQESPVALAPYPRGPRLRRAPRPHLGPMAPGW